MHSIMNVLAWAKGKPTFSNICLRGESYTPATPAYQGGVGWPREGGLNQYRPVAFQKKMGSEALVGVGIGRGSEWSKDWTHASILSLHPFASPKLLLS